MEKIWTKEEREDPISWGERNLTKAYIFYTSTSFTLEEQYHLFDVNAIVSALGGSLSLFLGFSFWQIIDATLRHISLYFKK